MYKMKSSVKGYSQLGMTLLEVLVALGLATIMSGIAVANLRQLNSESKNASAYMTSFIKQVRARAIASTLAYRIRPTSANYLISESSTTCSGTIWSADSRNRLSLPLSTRLLDTSWDICFNSRGFPDGNLEISLREANGATDKVEVMLGGATRTL